MFNLPTPGQLKLRGELYHQFSQMVRAGVPLMGAVAMAQAQPPAKSFRAPLTQLLAELQQGRGFAESLRQLGPWMPAFDVALIDAGEQSGRLDQCFQLLAGYYRLRGQLASEAISQMLYPAFLLHFGVLLFPINLLSDFVWQGKTWPFVLQKFFTLGPLYGGIIFIIYACQGKHGETWRAKIEKVSRWVPLLGKARHHLALARLAAALEALLNAGVPILNAWPLAAEASGSPALRAAVADWTARLARGDTPGQILVNQPLFPELFASLYRTGEQAGKLDETLLRLHAHYSEDGTARLRAFSAWLPKVIYFAIVLVVVKNIFSFYTGYFGELDKVLK
ncbi:MAG: type II secretion system F family protein [Verrucomicrobia bacterium]|nr:type II secretion system F family protein [Verrucomicrobiota bacterium]